MFSINLKYGRGGQYISINNEMIEICLLRFSLAISTPSPGNSTHKILTRHRCQSFVSDKFPSREVLVRTDVGARWSGWIVGDIVYSMRHFCDLASQNVCSLYS